MRSLVWRIGLAFVLISVACGAANAADWQPAHGPLKTRWTTDVSPDRALPEYPRPQLVRSEWTNLNGLWDYAIRPKAEQQPTKFDGQILVPFPVESSLSGVMKPLEPNNRLWYRRSFLRASAWEDKHLLLHFGAVDWDATVWVNGQKLGEHRGGYDGFSFDITKALVPDDRQDIVVAVSDPTDTGTQPRGKQVLHPGGIFYTPTSGIWQTVWLEPVPAVHIESLMIVPDVDHRRVSITVIDNGTPDVSAVELSAIDGETEVSLATGKAGQAIDLPIDAPRLWSPDNPFLYQLKVRLANKHGAQLDKVNSYFGMRKISIGKDSQGITRLMLNNRPQFMLGPLDQGFWPDGLYTAPTDAALRFDIETTRKLGFNLARKHVKVEPDRWYYWCDKLGLLVWQDMPAGDRGIGGKDPDLVRSPESAKQFQQELLAMIDGRRNHPSVVMWVVFNEGWGQFDTARMTELVKSHDPSRLVDSASGWTDRGAGDVHDLHSYPGPGSPEPEANRAAVLGEFGGLGLPVEGHTWQAKKNWGYRSFPDRPALTKAYLDLIDHLEPLTAKPGLSAAVYTQTTDVETEVNGLMTYDRELIKPDAEKMAAANRRATQAETLSQLAP